MNYLKKIYLAIIFLFLYAPIAVLIAQSFNASRYRGHWTGVTLDWYVKLFDDTRLADAISNTLSFGLDNLRGNERTFAQVAGDIFKHNEHSDFERGHRHGNFTHAFVHGLGLEARLRVDFVGSHRLQRALCNFMRHAAAYGVG